MRERKKMEIKCDAVVLKAADYKENDKLLTLFAAGYGKITALCRGVKKAGAKLKFAAQPFCFAEYVLVKRGERYTVISAFQHDGFYALRENITGFYAASAVLETCDRLLPEQMQSDRLFLLCVRTLSAMGEKDPSMPLLRFLLDALACAGYAVALDGCIACGQPIGERGYFSFARGGFLCRECGGEGDVPASGVTFRTLQAAKAGKTEAEGDGAKRALRLLKEYMNEKTEVKTECLSEYIRLI